jgi:ribosome-associated heat shock protein Hsp15
MKRDLKSENEIRGVAAVRIDKWLWAARFFKTRALAVDAIDGGKVELNGNGVKPSREVRPGDEVRVRLGPYVHVITVRGVSDRRGPSAVAATLYEETADSRATREKLAWTLRHAAPAIEPGEGRPTKKDRRDLDRLKRW